MRCPLGFVEVLDLPRWIACNPNQIQIPWCHQIIIFPSPLLALAVIYMQQPQQQQQQVSCTGCRVTLAFPAGAPCVRCPMCQTVTAAAQVHIRCVCCGVALALPSSTQLAQCPRCRTVMAMPRLTPSATGPSAAPPPPPKQVVYIENPPIKDAQGRITSELVIGTKLEDE